jgi:hypothetical protein
VVNLLKTEMAVYICKLQATMTWTLPVKQTSTTLTAEKVGTTHTCQELCYTHDWTNIKDRRRTSFIIKFTHCFHLVSW